VLNQNYKTLALERSHHY